MNKRLARAGVVLGWFLIVYGALTLAASLPVLYMLITGQVEPGKPYFVDDLAPTTWQALVTSAIGAAAVATGFVVKSFAARYKARDAISA